MGRLAQVCLSDSVSRRGGVLPLEIFSKLHTKWRILMLQKIDRIHVCQQRKNNAYNSRYLAELAKIRLPIPFYTSMPGGISHFCRKSNPDHPWKIIQLWRTAPYRLKSVLYTTAKAYCVSCRSGRYSTSVCCSICVSTNRATDSTQGSVWSVANTHTHTHTHRQTKRQRERDRTAVLQCQVETMLTACGTTYMLLHTSKPSPVF